jgi:hypothetical protein
MVCICLLCENICVPGNYACSESCRTVFLNRLSEKLSVSTCALCSDQSVVILNFVDLTFYPFGLCTKHIIERGSFPQERGASKCLTCLSACRVGKFVCTRDCSRTLLKSINTKLSLDTCKCGRYLSCLFNTNSSIFYPDKVCSIGCLE